MGRIPAPRGLLLDHPVFPVAISGSGGIEPDMQGTVAIRSLALPERHRAALQLMAGAALAAEFELWPGRGGIRKARARRISNGAQAVFGAFPIPLAVVHGRLGGGDAAVEITRNAVLESVAGVCGLSVDDLRPRDGLGYFLEGALRQSPSLQAEPVERIESRCLWAYQWNLPSLPDEGEIVYWKISDPLLTRRLGGAIWAALNREGRQALLVHGGARIKADGSESVLVMMGQHSEEVLAAVDAWAGCHGRAAVVIGDFPPGWDPPAPEMGSPQTQGRPLVVTGVSLDTALRVAEERQGRFDPWNKADRRALTEAASSLFRQQSPPSKSTGKGGVDPIHRALSLRLDGLDRTSLTELSGVDDATLLKRVADGQVVIDEGRWRLPTAPRLRPDPLHAKIADDFPERSPQRLLHEALAGGKTDGLQGWARSELNNLCFEEVREILGTIEPGVLGGEIAALMAEACLAGLDLAGGRQAIETMDDRSGQPWRLWIDLEDHDDNWCPPEIDPEVLLQEQPRIAAELAVHRMRGQKKSDCQVAFDAETLLDRAIVRLEGRLQNWYSILRESALRPQNLLDSGWVEDVTGGHDRLNRLAARKRALILTKRGSRTEAAEILVGLADVIRLPGMLGHIFIDLANVSIDQTEETTYLLRAHRLLEAAGFRHKTRTVVFNLAMVDLDRMRLDRAEARLRACARENDPMHTIGEGLLKLATGDLDGLSEIISRLPEAVAEQRVREGVCLLRGIEGLLSGRFRPARTFLANGGGESIPWLRLLNAAEGKDAGPLPLEDPWGVCAAADAVEMVRDTGERPAFEPDGNPSVQTALNCALADAVLSGDRWLSAADRDVVAKRLSSAGMFGWADQIRGASWTDFEVFSNAAARVADARSLQTLGENDWSSICGSLGLTGIEVQYGIDGKALWRWGFGEPYGGERRGHFNLIPLGALPTSQGGWNLLERLVESIALSPVEDQSGDDGGSLGIAGIEEPIRTLRKELQRFAPTRLTVLLAGETGVGKGLAAEAVHNLSGRKGRFVSVNAAAVTGTLFEAELFGAVKGAFTGADRDRVGLAEEADGGTLFLDEIGDLDLSLQVKLLRFLDSGEVRRVGSGRIRNFDVRVVAASHRDLQSMVADGTFRQDLFYRMGSARIVVPPLRERGQDVLVLRDLFVERILHDQQLKPVRWSREADAALLAHNWPGNVRELHHAVEIALIQADGGVVGLEHLPAQLAAKTVSEPRLWEDAHRDLRIELIRSSLERNDGNRSATARELGFSRPTLLYHMRLLGLE